MESGRHGPGDQGGVGLVVHHVGEGDVGEGDRAELGLGDRLHRGGVSPSQQPRDGGRGRGPVMS